MVERGELEGLVAEYLERREREPGLTPEAFAGEHGELCAELLEAIHAARDVQALLGAAAFEVPERVGPYRIGAVLGRGGMGLVLEAERDSRRYALKLLALGLAAAPRALERFQREARILARLAHPGIVRVHDTGVFQGAPYLVMERVEGPTLAELALPIAPERAARIVRELALAVEAAHEAGVLHRDLKPSNVILRPGDAPVLLDFGLVAAEEEATLTSSGALLGTPRYMAPEQAEGRPAEPRTDVHALGLILFELLHGVPARPEGSRAEVLARVRRGRLSAERGRVPRELRRVLGSALAREPRRRPPSSAALAEELGRFLAGQRVRVRAPRPHERLADALRRYPLRALLAAGALAALLLGLRQALVAPELVAEARAERDRRIDAALCAWMQGSEALARVELERARVLDRGGELARGLETALFGSGPAPREPEWVAGGLVPLLAGAAAEAASGLSAPARDSGVAAALHARALAQAGDRERALAAARGGAARFPASAAILAELARLLEHTGEPGQALALLRGAPVPVAEQAPLLAARARLALASGAFDEAVEVALRAAQGFEASGGDAAAELPRLLALAEASPETRAALRRRMEGGDRRALVPFALGYALDSDHRLEEAVSAYERALELDPGLVRARLNLAHLHAGAQLGACRACDRAYAGAPGMLAPERALEHLREALARDRGEGELCVARAVQTALTLGARSPGARAGERLGLCLGELLARADLSPGGRRRLEEGLARLRGAEGE
jgi:tetratricopeptide (TPR) repeat protein